MVLVMVVAVVMVVAAEVVLLSVLLVADPDMTVASVRVTVGQITSRAMRQISEVLYGLCWHPMPTQPKVTTGKRRMRRLSVVASLCDPVAVGFRNAKTKSTPSSPSHERLVSMQYQCSGELQIAMVLLPFYAFLSSLQPQPACSQEA